MKLYLIKTEKEWYATSAEASNEARSKFSKIYEGRTQDILSIKKLSPENLIRMEDNDNIIFF